MASESLHALSTGDPEAEAGSPPPLPVPGEQNTPQDAANPTPEVAALEAAPLLTPTEDDLLSPPGAESAEALCREEPPSRALPTSDAFLRRLLRSGGSSSHGGDGGGSADDDKPSLPEDELRELEAALAATEDFPDPSAGTDDAARVLQHFCRRYGGDARTLRTIVDVLLRLEPPLHTTDLWLCLTAFIPRFAPVALLLEAGRTVIRLCQLFEQLLLFHDPEVAFLLRRAKLGAEIYCAPWILTAHAAGLADPGAVLHIWDGWLERRGESLDPIFLGLARLMLCHEELLLCGPVPELAQLLQASLGAEQHSSPRVVQDALRRAEELKTLTPLTFLRQLQDALLRPPAAEEPAVVAETVASPRSGPPPASPRGDGKVTSPQSGAPLITPRAKAAAWIRNRWTNATHAFHSESAEAAGAKAGTSVVCMRVEPQDVMMMETVKERHFKKAAEKKAASESPDGGKKAESPGAEQVAEKTGASESPGGGKKAGSESPGAEQATSESPEGGKNAVSESPGVEQAAEKKAESPDDSKNAGPESPGVEQASAEAAIAEEPAPAGDEKTPSAAKGCRLLPKLIDVRPVGESRSNGVKGAVGVNVAATDSVPEFIKWAAKRESDAAAYGLRPMHILMTADGSINADQQRFISGSLQKGLTAICVLAGGYNSLKPFFVEPADGASSDPRALAERAQEAKELLQKGIGGLHGLWQKAPSRQHLKQNLLERVAPEGARVAGARATKTPATFERAPLPPSVVLPAASPTSASAGGPAELIGTGAKTPTGADAVF